MGILPFQFRDGENAQSLGLDGSEQISLSSLDEVTPCGSLKVAARKQDGSQILFEVKVLLNSPAEVKLWKNGGILRSFTAG